MQSNHKRNKKSKNQPTFVVISSQSEINQDKNKQQSSNDKIKQIPIRLAPQRKTFKINGNNDNDQIQSSKPKKKIKLNQNNNNQEIIIRFDSLKNGDGQQQQNQNAQNQVVKQKRKQKQATPWLTKTTRNIEDACLRFHNEVVQFYEYIRPTNKQHDQRLKVFNLVKQLINQKYPQAQVIYFGSFATRLYLPDGDIDVTVKIDVENDFQQRKIYDNIHKIIKKCEGNIFMDIEYIRKSKVPLIKFIHADTGLQFDISVNKLDGIKQIDHVEKMKKKYPQFQALVFVFKCSLKIRNMSETYTGGIGSFLLFCMILHFLRYVHKKKCYYTLGQLVLKFMEYYSITGDWERISVYVADGSEIGRSREPGTLSFYSPQDDSHDIGKSAYKIRDSFNMFKNRFRLILGKNFRQKQSILKQLINPQLEQFRYYRYEKQQNKTAN